MRKLVKDNLALNLSVSALILLFGAIPAHPASTKKCEKIIAALVKDGMRFQMARGVEHYRDTFGKNFDKILRERTSDKKSGRWIDMGAGYGFAAIEYLEEQRDGHKPLPDVAIVRAEKLDNDIDKDLARHFSTYNGKLLEDIPRSEIGKADLITDYYGPLVYSSHPEKIIEEYLDLLNPGGKAYLVLGHTDDIDRTQIVGKDGVAMTLPEWLGGIEGIDIKFQKVSGGLFDTGKLTVAVITKIGRTPKIPELNLVGVKKGSPPHRILTEGMAPEPHDWLLKRDEEYQIVGSEKRAELTHMTPGSSPQRQKARTYVLLPNEKGTSTLKKEDFLIQQEKFSQSATLITDILGPFSSSLEPDRYLSRYLAALTDRGQIRLGLPSIYHNFDGTRNSRVVMKDGTIVSLEQWLKTIPGIRVTIKKYDSIVLISIIDRAKIKIPSLKFLGEIPKKVDRPDAKLFMEN